VNQDGYGGAFDGVWMVGRWGNLPTEEMLLVGMWTERDGRRKVTEFSYSNSFVFDG
jgi:hypothetical protein